MATRVSFRTCPLCEATCGLRIETEDGRVTRIRGDADDPFSKGFICPKGSTLGALHEDPDRLRRPLLRHDGAHEEMSWEEAFAEVERRLTTIVATHGPDAVAVYIGNPNAHNFANTLAIRPLVKALRTKNVYSASTVDQMPKHVACGLVFGHPLAIPVPDLDRTDFLLMLGANPLESNGSLATAPDWPGRLEAIRRRGGRVVVVDPRRTRTAEHADLHVPIRPGTDAALLAGIARTLFAEGLASPGALTVAGIEVVEAAVAGFTPERVSSFTGVAAETVVSLARELAAAPDGRRLRADRHAHDRVRHARRLARRRAQRDSRAISTVPAARCSPTPPTSGRGADRGRSAPAAGTAACAACRRRWASCPSRRSPTRSRRAAEGRCGRCSRSPATRR